MNEERKFIERARLALDARAAGLDPRSAARLREARGNALATPRRIGHSGWIPALALASLAAVFVGVMWFGAETQRPEAGMVQANAEHGVTDFELLTSSEDLELYERLDFYYWLEQRSANAG